MQKQQNYKQKINHKLSPQQIELINNSQYIRIVWDHSWKLLLDQLQSIHTQEIQTHKRQKESTKELIPSIIKLSFPSLTHLSLSNSDIASIQSIYLLQAPLQSLILSSNMITNIKSIRKAHFPHLKLLDLSFNKLSSSAPLTELYSEQQSCEIKIQNMQRKYPPHHKRRQNIWQILSDPWPLLKLPKNIKFVAYPHNLHLMTHLLPIIEQKYKKEEKVV